MADAVAVELCASDALIDRGRAVVFDVLLWGRPARAFVLRFDGHLVAYMNQCAHVAAEMDWQRASSSTPTGATSSAPSMVRPTSRATASALPGHAPARACAR
jgi:nitrite reductase/ring-hydroxylating ferredoxin subunit